MLRHSSMFTCFLLALAALARVTMGAGTLPAFPGAEGFGANTPGGRGGKTVFVSNLQDYDPAHEPPIPGSLRAAIIAAGPRIVVFRVSGTIALHAPLRIKEPFITIAGQTAPGDGICLKNHEVTTNANDIIIRYLRFRTGDEIGEQLNHESKPFWPDAFCVGEGSRNVIVDHCSASWSIDESLSVSGVGITDVTVQWCLIAESLNHSFHQKSNGHGYGSLIRCNGNVTFHHNLYAHHNSRTPRPGTYGPGSILLDFRNNLIYNSIRGGYSSTDPARMNYVGNSILHGPSTIWNDALRVGSELTEVYEEGNRMVGYANKGGKEPRLIANVEIARMRKQPFPAAPVTTETAEKATERILRDCGAARPVRDAVDRRIIEDVRTGKGRIIDSQKEVGGWPELKTSPQPRDSDGDGMPDEWESSYGLDPTDFRDGIADKDGDGYTNLEEWLNGTDPKVPEPSAGRAGGGAQN